MYFREKLLLIGFLSTQMLLAFFFFGVPVLFAEETTPVLPKDTQGTSALSIDTQKCMGGIAQKIGGEGQKLENSLEAYTELSDIPTEEQVVRAKIGLQNFVDFAESVCEGNLLSGAPLQPKYLVAECRPDSKASLEGSKVDTSSSLKNNVERSTCDNLVTTYKERYEHMITGFATWDVQNKVTYTYAKSLEELNLALQSFNKDFEITKGDIARVVSSVNHLVSGKNAGQ